MEMDARKRMPMTGNDAKAPNRTAIVTGASSGIGLEFSRLLAREGYALVLVARDERKLGRLASELGTSHGIATAAVAADLATPAGAAQVGARMTALGWQPDVLINSAGRGVYGPFAETPLASEIELLNVNVVGLTEMTKQVLPAMIARRRGRILNIASTAAFVPGPLMSVYYASKAYVLSFSESLAGELEGTGVTVTVLCPPPTRSGFQSGAQMESSKLVKGKKLMGPDEVAKAGYEGMISGRGRVVPGFANWLSVQMVPFFPRRMLATYVRGLQARSQ